MTLDLSRRPPCQNSTVSQIDRFLDLVSNRPKYKGDCLMRPLQEALSNLNGALNKATGASSTATSNCPSKYVHHRLGNIVLQTDNPTIKATLPAAAPRTRQTAIEHRGISELGVEFGHSLELAK